MATWHPYFHSYLLNRLMNEFFSGFFPVLLVVATLGKMEKDLFIDVTAAPSVIHFGYSGLGESCFHFKMPLAKVVKKQNKKQPHQF